MDALETLREEIAAVEAVAACPACGDTWFEVIISKDGKEISHYRCKCGHQIPARKVN